MKPIVFNEKLIWDYDIPPDAQENEAFREWYVKRVLTHGTAEDIRAMGLEIIHHYLAQIYLPRDIHEFWSWYFNLPEIRKQYGDFNQIPEETP